VHLSETCDDDKPHLIVQTETTAATTPDWGMAEPIHDALAQQDCLPSTHVVDGGYVDADAIVTSRSKHNVELVGPVPLENRGPRESRTRLRSFALPHRVAEPDGHLSHRTAESFVDAHQRSLWTGGDLRQVCTC
jgi:transposase